MLMLESMSIYFIATHIAVLKVAHESITCWQRGHTCGSSKMNKSKFGFEIFGIDYGAGYFRKWHSSSENRAKYVVLRALSSSCLLAGQVDMLGC